jgi:hypothetical protein
MTERANSTGVCPRSDCTSPAFRTYDDLSYATGHYLWICLAGHEVHEPGPASGRSVA